MRCRDIHRYDERMGGDSTGANAATSIHMYTIPVVDGFLWSKGGVMELTKGEMRVAAPGEWWMEWGDAGGVKSVKRPENGVVRWELSISL